MSNRPYVLLSCASSIDGYIDDATPDRLLLSNDADFDRVDQVRAECDAILVGSNTIRKDNPRLLVRSEERRRHRVARGLPESPVKVTITASGDLDAGARFFTVGDGAKIVYAPSGTTEKARENVGAVAVVVDAGEPVDLNIVLADLADRGIARLMVEGGGTMHTQFLTAGLADELHLVIAPFFVGDPAASRFVTAGQFPWDSHNRARLAGTTQIGDLVLLRYALSDRYQGDAPTEP